MRELTERHGNLERALGERVGSVVAEFSLDNKESALSRLVGRVDQAQGQISAQFSLDNPDSGLTRIVHGDDMLVPDRRKPPRLVERFFDIPGVAGRDPDELEGYVLAQSGVEGSVHGAERTRAEGCVDHRRLLRQQAHHPLHQDRTVRASQGDGRPGGRA